MAQGLSPMGSSMSMANMGSYAPSMPGTPRGGAPSTPRGLAPSIPGTPRGYSPAGFNASVPSTPHGGPNADQFDSPQSTDGSTPRLTPRGTPSGVSPYTGLPTTPLTAAANSAFSMRGPGIGRRPTGEGPRRMSNLGDPSYAESPVH